MRRNIGSNVGGLISPSSKDFAAKGPTIIRNAGFHPPCYYEWTEKPKALRSMKHWAVAAGNEDNPSAWVYPQAIDLCGEGFLQLVRWSYLEPTVGVYNFTATINALNWLYTTRPTKKLMIRLKDKSYLSSNGAADFLTDTSKSLPDHFNGQAYTVYQGGSPAGWGPKIWEQAVRDKFFALIDAIAANLGSHPSFAGICVDESTLSMSYPYPGDYNLDKNNQYRREILLYAKEKLPNKIIMQPINYFDGNDGSGANFSASVDTFTSWCLSNGIEISLVDTCPTTESFRTSMAPVLVTNKAVNALVDAGRVYPLTDMSAPNELANVTSNFTDVRDWLLKYENISNVFWPIANSNTFSALQTVLA
jgi:hypothetical protein